MSAYLDTNVAVWLHAGKAKRLSVEAKRQIEKNDLLISPIVLLELQLLYNRKRITAAPESLYGDLNSDLGVSICAFPFASVVREALAVGWTNDPFDRLIVAQASVNHRERLITADSEILQYYDRAVW